MSGIRTLVVLSLAGLASAQAAFSNLEPCGTQCVNQVMAKAGTFNCPASDFACLCGNVNWGNAIHDCAQGICPPGYAATVTSAASAVCATATLPVGAVATSSAAPATTTSKAPTSTRASSSASSSAVSSTTPASSSSATTLETSTTSPAASTTAAAATTTPSSTSASSSATPADAAASTSAAADTSDSQGLPEAAKIGIGIGAGAALIVLLSIAACVFLRKRNAAAGGSGPGSAARIDRLKISHPMPTDEHPYPTMSNNRTSDYDIGGNELEMKSRRYEDMVPHTEPRQMV